MDYKIRGTNILGIEVIVTKENWNIEELKKFLIEKKAILKRIRLIITFDDIIPEEKEIKEVANFCSQLPEVFFSGFKTNKKETRDLCVSAGFPCDMSKLELEKQTERASTEEIKFIKKTVRSGEKVSSSGDIAILGDVNPGAEVEAGGNVYIFGSLRGLVKAGIGKKECEVRALFVQTPRMEICGREKIFERNEKFLNFRLIYKNDKIKVLAMERSKNGR
ncbi:septum site-determining protein MinC [Desulfurobacterium sp.]|uniref:septum site-determining protein MinC n=1 Tax=Desulfurobacterium sp. TaxID=2004706 RepID=UPI0026084462|nr:septum site-determining protein MinC [Desulfurobacterium sp.]